jgi:anti-anti-sigma regulatory factor
MQRAQFQTLDPPRDDLFVVKISGHLGTREKSAVSGLLSRCRKNPERHLALEVSELKSMGGSVAASFGEYAEEAAARSVPFCVVGAAESVRSCLVARFKDVEPIFVPSISQLPAAFSRGMAAAAPEAESAQPNDDSGPSASLEPVESVRIESADAEDEIEALVEQTLAFEPTHDYDETLHSLAAAQEPLAAAADLRHAAPTVVRLLCGTGLVDHATLFCLEGDVYSFAASTNVEESDLHIPATGAFVEFLRRRDEPVSREDLAGQLSAPERRAFDRLRADMAVPIHVDQTLEGVALVGADRREAPRSELLALDLLARHVGHAVSPSSVAAAQAEPADQNLRDQLRRQRTVLRLSREFHAIDSEERLVSRLLISLIGEMGISAAVLYVEKEGVFLPDHVYGMDQSALPELRPVESGVLEGLTKPLAPIEADPALWGEEVRSLGSLGVDLLVPFRGPRVFIGILALAVRRSREDGRFDPAYLDAFLGQAGLAAEHVRAVQELEDQTLEVAKTLITLIESKSGAGSRGRTEQIARYSQRVAEALGYDPDDLRDLRYGAVLRDIGMIEIADLVLKSPRSLTPDEWKQIEGHPEAGMEILRRMGFSRHTCDVVRYHHERFNGQGYPSRLRGDAIPLGARIVAVVESYVAMIHDLPYRKALDPLEALEVLRENWEMRYDPRVIEAFLALIEQEELGDEAMDEDELLMI